MHEDYVDRTIVQDSKLYYFDANTHDEYYEYTIENCVSHADILETHEWNILPYRIVQISEFGV